MPNMRDIALWKYDISKNRYRELRYFCEQYGEWKKCIKNTRGLSAVASDGMPRGNKTSNPVEAQALRNLKYIDNIKLVEDTCKEADEDIWKYLLKNVTERITYEELPVPCGRERFYRSRRKFFYMLDLKRP